MEEKLFEMCEEMLEILSCLDQQKEITEEEFEEHKKIKLEFIESYSKRNIQYEK